MASLDMKMTLESGEDLSFTIPGCLSSKEVEELLKGLQSSLGPHLPPSASDQIKRLTAPTGPCMPPPTTAQASSPDSSASGKASTFFRAPDLSITAIISPKTLEPFSLLQL